MGTCETQTYMEKLVFTMACLFCIRVIMAIMCVLLVELLCQEVMGWIPALEYLLSDARGACGHVLSCQVVNAATYRAPDAC
jgi:hypothetical protein